MTEQKQKTSPHSTLTPLKVRILPGARKDEIVGWTAGCLKLKIAAPPVEGRANKALIKFISKKLGVKVRQVSLNKGEKSREKTLHIEGLSPSELKAKLNL
jgi:uncharacterized protein (TIGR00251 family)